MLREIDERGKLVIYKQKQTKGHPQGVSLLCGLQQTVVFIAVGLPDRLLIANDRKKHFGVLLTSGAGLRICAEAL